MANCTGSDIKISKTQIRNGCPTRWITLVITQVFWSSLKFSTVVLLTASSLASIVLTGLATGALSSLGNFGMDKIFIMESLRRRRIM